MWNKKSPALLHRVNRMPEWCTVNLEQKPRSSFQASLLAARTLAHNSYLTAGALGSIREEKKLLGSGESWRQHECFRCAITLCVSLCITQLSPNHSARGKAALTSSDRYARWECSLSRVGRSGFLSTSVLLHLQTTMWPHEAPRWPQCYPEGRVGNLALRNKWAFFQKHGDLYAHLGHRAGRVRMTQLK